MCSKVGGCCNLELPEYLPDRRDVGIDILGWALDPDTAHGVHLLGPKRTWTMFSYRDLALNAARVTALLHDSCKNPGGVVSLVLSEPQDFIAALAGVWLTGRTASPVATPVGFRGRSQYIDHLGRIVKAADPVAVLCDAGLLDTVVAALREAESPATPVPLDWTAAPPSTSGRRAAPPDMALLQFTSGSSGQPKGIRISAGNLAANLEAIHKWVSFSAGDSVASWLPLYHDMGLIGSLLTTATKGCDLWLSRPEQFLRDPLIWLECLGRHGATITTAPNFGYAYAARKVRPEQIADLDFSPWRVAIIGAERVDPKAISNFAELAVPRGFRATSLVPAYGLAEATLAVSGVVPGRPSRIVRLKADSLQTGSPVVVEAESRLGIGFLSGSSWLSGCGQPVPGTRVIIRDEENKQLPAGYLGQICVAGPGVAMGYQDRHRGGSTSFTHDELRTGDAGFLLDGEVFVIGRIGDSLKVRGRRVHAEDIEYALTETLGLSMGRVGVAMGSLPDTDLAAAVIERRDAALPAEILGSLRALLGETVSLALFVARAGEIPRTSSGKVRRSEIWRRVTGGAPPGNLALMDWKPASVPPPWAATADPEPPAVRT